MQRAAAPKQGPTWKDLAFLAAVAMKKRVSRDKAGER